MSLYCGQVQYQSKIAMLPVMLLETTIRAKENKEKKSFSIMEPEKDVLMVSKIFFELSSPAIQNLLKQTYLAPANPSDVGKEFAIVHKVQVAKRVVDLPVGYKDKLVHVFFILNEASEATFLRKDALIALIGNEKAEIPKSMKVTINGFEHEIIPAENLKIADVVNYNVLGDDFITKYCSAMPHAYEGSFKLHFKKKE